MNMSERSPDPRRAGARILDTAEGVLLALRGCTLNQAFVEIVQTAKSHNVSTLSLADAGVAVARAAWGDLFDQSPQRRAASPPPHQCDDEDDEAVSGA